MADVEGLNPSARKGVQVRILCGAPSLKGVLKMKNLSDKVILTIQVSGFMMALAMLPAMHGLFQVLFAVGFTVHFIGDLFRLHKDGVI